MCGQIIHFTTHQIEIYRYIRTTIYKRDETHTRMNELPAYDFALVIGFVSNNCVLLRKYDILLKSFLFALMANSTKANRFLLHAPLGWFEWVFFRTLLFTISTCIFGIHLTECKHYAYVNGEEKKGGENAKPIRKYHANGSVRLHTKRTPTNPMQKAHVLSTAGQLRFHRCSDIYWPLFLFSFAQTLILVAAIVQIQTFIIRLLLLIFHSTVFIRCDTHIIQNVCSICKERGWGSGGRWPCIL